MVPRVGPRVRRADGAWRGFGRWLILGLMACDPTEKDSGTEEGSPYVRILSPMDGAYLDEGVATLLEAEGRAGDGSPLDFEEPPRWVLLEDGAAQGWEAQGERIEVDDLPAGIWELKVETSLDGEPVSAQVGLVVYARARVGSPG